MIVLQKNTNNDKRDILSRELKNLFAASEVWIWLRDYDDTYVYFDYELYINGTYLEQTFRVSYNYSGTMATFNDDMQEVVKLSDYQVVSSEPSSDSKGGKDDESLIKPVGSDNLENNDGPNRGAVVEDYVDTIMKSREDGLVQKLLKALGKNSNAAPVIKQFQEEKMQAVEPLYIVPETVDGQGDTYDREDADGMVASLNKAIDAGTIQSGLFHQHSSDAFTIEKAWVNEVECQIGDTIIAEGQPMCLTQFHNEAAWELRKNGTLMGLSIGCIAEEVEYL